MGALYHFAAFVPGRMLGEYFTYLRESSGDLSGCTWANAWRILYVPTRVLRRSQRVYLGECLANTLRTYASPQEISAGVPGRMLGEYFTYLRESSADLSGDNNGNLLSERRRGRTIRRFTYDGANRL